MSFFTVFLFYVKRVFVWGERHPVEKAEGLSSRSAVNGWFPAQWVADQRSLLPLKSGLHTGVSHV